MTLLSVCVHVYTLSRLLMLSAKKSLPYAIKRMCRPSPTTGLLCETLTSAFILHTGVDAPPRTACVEATSVEHVGEETHRMCKIEAVLLHVGWTNSALAQ